MIKGIIIIIIITIAVIIIITVGSANRSHTKDFKNYWLFRESFPRTTAGAEHFGGKK